MFVEAGGQHNRPHFHAYYQDHDAVYAIDVIEPMAGSLPTRQERLTVAWAEIRQRELLENWSALQAGRPAGKIEPLR